MTDEIILVTYQDEHWYKIVDGDQIHYLPSVTTKTGIKDKPGLNRWRGDIGNREADLRMYDAGQRGTRIHWAWETALKGGCVVYDPWNAPVLTPEGIDELRAKHGGRVAILRTQDEMYDISKLQMQFDRLNPKVVAVEYRVYDLEHRDAGTIDHVYQIEEGEYMIAGSRPLYLAAGLYIGDLKTGKYLDENVWLQMAPYAAMFEQITGETVIGALVTHTGSPIKSGIPGLKTIFRDRTTLLTKDYIDYRHAAALWERDHADDQPRFYEFPAIINLNLKEKQKRELSIIGHSDDGQIPQDRVGTTP